MKKVFIFVNEIQPNICFTKKIKRMKKLYTLALGLALGAIGLSANAEVTKIPAQYFPESNEITSFEDLYFYCDALGGPVITWDSPIYYNTDSYDYSPDYEVIYVDFLADGETIGTVYAEIENDE